MLTVAALYRFTPFADAAALAPPLRAACDAAGVRGTLILAAEGINGTIAGTAKGIAAVMAHLRGLPGCADLSCAESRAETMPFDRMKVRVKSEIVTMGATGADPLAGVGTYVDPADWNALITAPDVALIDTRNAFEVAVGTFDGAIDPGIAQFRDFPAWWQDNAARLTGKRIATFCTGGIRCERATAWLVAQGVAEVYHLKGGILAYLDHVAEADSLWHGGCFVFDGRGALGPGLRIEPLPAPDAD